MLLLFRTLLYIIIFFLGASIFSFLNVVIYRLPRKIPFVKGRSFCPSCKRQLKGYDMVPVLSWLFLGGRCRGCRERISVRYPVVETLGGLLLLLCLKVFGTDNGVYLMPNFQVLVIFAALSVLTCVAFIDADTMEIPDRLVLAMFVPAVCAAFAFPQVGLTARFIGFFAVSLPLLLLTLAVPGAFGGGDIKLMAAGGFLLGWKMCLVAFALAVLSGGIYGLWLLAAKAKSRKEHFAFGPFLCAGMGIAMFAGEPLLRWYLHLIF